MEKLCIFSFWYVAAELTESRWFPFRVDTLPSMSHCASLIISFTYLFLSSVFVSGDYFPNSELSRLIKWSLRSLTCDTTVHCFSALCIVSLQSSCLPHMSQWFMSNPHSINWCEFLFQKRQTSHKVMQRALKNLAYSMELFFVIWKYFLRHWFHVEECEEKWREWQRKSNKT